MGIKSTRNISKEEALDFIKKHLDSLSDRTIADIVEEVNDDLYSRDSEYMIGHGLHNFCIT